jgi:uncharacterized membrane protein
MQLESSLETPRVAAPALSIHSRDDAADRATIAAFDAAFPDAVSDDAPAKVRTLRERTIQTLAYEAGGLAVASPIWALLSGDTGGETLFILVCISLAAMSWAAIYNTAADLAESRLAGRLASDRPHHWRLLHAVGLEASSIVVTMPLIVLLTGFSWLHALVADIGLTLLYAVYGYFFHIVFDRLRPVGGLR